MARPMPVLPEVGSMIVTPGFNLPLRSASSIIDSPMRSLIDPPGFARSDFIQTLCVVPNRRLMRMCGVLPMVSRMFAAFMFFLLSVDEYDGRAGDGRRYSLDEAAQAGLRASALP